MANSEADIKRIKAKIADLQGYLPTYRANLAKATTDSDKMNWKGKIAGLENEIKGLQNQL